MPSIIVRTYPLLSLPSYISPILRNTEKQAFIMPVFEHTKVKNQMTSTKILINNAKVTVAHILPLQYDCMSGDIKQNERLIST
jgi:hypothetical protein